MKTKTERRNYRVIKTLAPTDRGALGLARSYGEALICVRYRTDAKGKVRHTTVELLVQSQPIRPRSVKVVSLKVSAHERSLQTILQTAGGKWDSVTRTWRLPRRVVGILNLKDRIVDE